LQDTFQTKNKIILMSENIGGLQIIKGVTWEGIILGNCCWSLD